MISAYAGRVRNFLGFGNFTKWSGDARRSAISEPYVRLWAVCKSALQKSLEVFIPTILGKRRQKLIRHFSRPSPKVMAGRVWLRETTGLAHAHVRVVWKITIYHAEKEL